MIDTTDFTPAFKAKLAEVEAQFSEKEAEVATARQAVKAAEDAAFAAARRYEHFQLHVLRACRVSISIGSDERMLSLVTAPLDELDYQELQLKQAADMALTRAQRAALANRRPDLTPRAGSAPISHSQIATPSENRALMRFGVQHMPP